jgi:drug/metabolite transporter (DMT)-like permease
MVDTGKRVSLNLEKAGPLFIMTAAFIWTLDVIFRDNLLNNGFKSLQIVLIEHLIVVLVIIPWIVRYLPDLLEFSLFEWGALIFIGFGGGALATAALTEAYNLGFITMAVLLQQTQPFIAIGLAYVLLKEKLLKNKEYLILIITAILGVFLIFFPILTNFTEDLSQLFVLTDIDFLILNALGGIFALIAAFFWGGSTVFGRYLLGHSEKRLDYRAMTTYRFLIALIFLSILNFVLILTGTSFPSLDAILLNITSITISFLFIAMIVSLLSLGLYYFGLKNTHATVSSICELFYPLSAFVILPFLLNEHIYFSQIVGGGILLIASGALSYHYSKSVNTTYLSDERATDEITSPPL